LGIHEQYHHPTEKPVSWLVPLIQAFSKPGDIVLDPFAGSGSTDLAADACQRRFVLIELSEAAVKKSPPMMPTLCNRSSQ